MSTVDIILFDVTIQHGSPIAPVAFRKININHNRKKSLKQVSRTSPVFKYFQWTIQQYARIYFTQNHIHNVFRWGLLYGNTQWTSGHVLHICTL